MIAWVERHHAHVSGLVLTAIPTDGAFYAMLRAQSAASGRDLALLDVRKRAVLRPSRDLGTVTSILSSKRRKELRRQRRRLAETGALSYRSATTPSEIRAAAERFLMLESRGWKGRRGTALLAQVALATFTRTMTRLMAQERHCRIDSLEIDGVPIAMGIIIVADTHAHFWKTAYDERFAARSPGVQFVLELTALQEADRSVRLTDSCAIPDHPMIDRIWDERLDIADVFIGLRPQDRGRAGAAAALRWETTRRRLRATAKDGLGALRRLTRTRIASH